MMLGGIGEERVSFLEERLYFAEAAAEIAARMLKAHDDGEPIDPLDWGWLRSTLGDLANVDRMEGEE